MCPDPFLSSTCSSQASLEFSLYQSVGKSSSSFIPLLLYCWKLPHWASSQEGIWKEGRGCPGKCSKDVWILHLRTWFNCEQGWIFSSLSDCGVNVNLASVTPLQQEYRTGLLLIPQHQPGHSSITKAYQQPLPGTGTMIPTFSKAIGCLTSVPLLQSKCLLSQSFIPVHLDLNP